MFSIRELAGWGLIAIALMFVWSAFDFLESQKVVEASVTVFAASFVFRGGIHLVKMATAARVVVEANQK
ncbi:hypothetical protein GC176_11355 [bacterium]|nr:hypothetical protein [bacterium]